MFDYSMHTMTINRELTRFWDAIEYGRMNEALERAIRIEAESQALVAAAQKALTDSEELIRKRQNG